MFLIQVWVVRRISLYHRPLGVHHFVEAVSEGLVHVVVNTRLRSELGGLPEFTSVVTAVVIIQQVLRHPADCEQTHSVGLASRVEGVQIALMLVVAFVVEHFDHAVVRACIWHAAVGQRTHRVHALADCVEGKTESGSKTCSYCSRPESVDPARTQEVV